MSSFLSVSTTSVQKQCSNSSVGDGDGDDSEVIVQSEANVASSLSPVGSRFSPLNRCTICARKQEAGQSSRCSSRE